MEVPDVSYARSGDVAIAYQVVGEGPPDLVMVRGFAGDLLSTWEQPLLLRHVVDLSAFSRVLMLDKRGQGLSDRLREVPTLEMRMDDLRAVMDAAGSERAIVWSAHEGARLAVLFAATYPERVSGLVLFEPEATGTRSADYPWARDEGEWTAWLGDVRDGWGQRDFFERLLRDWAPTQSGDAEFTDWFVSHMRRSLSPGAALAFFRAMRDADVSDILPAVRVPTVVLYSAARKAESAYTAERIPGADMVELIGLRGVYTWLDDRAHELAMRATEGLAGRIRKPEEPTRILATVLFTDMAGSTERAAALGDRGWRDLIERYHALVRAQLARCDGTEVDEAGDGILATFDGPVRAIRCACELRQVVAQLGVEVRSGIHTGETELAGGKPRGLAVHIGARVASLARPGEVVVSRTVKDLVAGSGISFDDRGEHELKGVPGTWSIYAVSDV